MSNVQNGVRDSEPPNSGHKLPAQNRTLATLALIFAGFIGMAIVAILLLLLYAANQPHYHDGADPTPFLLGILPTTGILCLSPISIVLGVLCVRSGSVRVGIISCGAAIGGASLVLWLLGTLGFI